MRIGIIGTGKHGSRYANHIVHDVDGLELAAISRRSEEVKTQAAQWQCNWYQDWQQLVADQQVEAVVSVVPPALNLAIARHCAARKKPLLLEKPLADTVEAATEIVHLYQEHNLPLTTGQTLRYNQVIQTLKSS